MEFIPHPSINDEEAIEMIRQSRGTDGGESKDGGESNLLHIRNHRDEEETERDLFGRCINTALENQVHTLYYRLKMVFNFNSAARNREWDTPL